jgi:hypothetical protein
MPRAIQRRRASFGLSTSSDPLHTSHDGLLREACSPVPNNLVPEPASPLIGLFRLLSLDETDRVEAAIPIAALQCAITPRNRGQSSGQIILGPCTVGNARAQRELALRGPRTNK